MAHPAAPRWPSVRPDRGHYESYYLRAVDPGTPRGVWIRYTVSRPAGGQPEGQLWFTFFDRARPGPRAVRVAAGEPASGPGEWIRLADSMFGEGCAVGRARSDDVEATWELRWAPGEETLRHLDREWMYRSRLPRTKLLSLTPATSFDGTLEIDGERIDVAGWPGMVGHNWGEQHAERWIWLHGIGFTDSGADTWLDLAIARVRLGPMTTPWVANGALSVGGRRLRLGGLGRRPRVSESLTGCEVALAGGGATVAVSVSAPGEAFARWDYANPDGAVHQVVNCSVADLSLRVTRDGRPPVELSAPAGGVYEFGRAADS
jgi:hypothetical protein